MAHHVILSPAAKADIRSARRWISQHHSEAQAVRWMSLLVKAIDGLAEDPVRHPEAGEATTLDVDLRQALFSRPPHVYRLLFTIDRDTVFVYRVRHSSRDWLTPDDL